MLYLVLKSLHILTVIIWMGGMVLLSAGFLWLREAACPRSERETALLAAIKRWDSRVTSPAMGLAWIFGLVVAWEGDWFSQPWLHAKLAVVIALSALHGNLSATVRRLANDPGRTPPGFLGSSGLITIAAIAAIVFLVVLKPF
ncbi:CopD family protein [Pararhizobium sp. O133]|uniref:CopD family protein n=1 Tax=Pararhizobium sp. O133 TaxID=3449278 RepID=UPI003F688B52